MLKSTYRIDRDSQSDWYEIADLALSRLNLDVPLTIYQAQNAEGMNASLAYLPSEAHIILFGPITSKLSREELLSVFAHELSHLLLWQQWDGDFLIVDQILAALTIDRKAHPAHLESMRLLSLYNEIFCDRGSLFVTEDPNVVISSLVKISSGLDTVNAESYLKQAAEIFERETGPSQSLSHPESYVRARAVRLWHNQDVDAETKITEMIQGQPALNELDLLAQRTIEVKTRRMVDLLLVPKPTQPNASLRLSALKI
ncbi:M48 family metalloprotease [Bremerella alba]|uniref:M48 family metalloprotease n=1 Tax=Bremerella alba TaxID=980252 RepID=UPI001A95490D|nr:M48 family metalloprotease [Bremerella alba]